MLQLSIAVENYGYKQKKWQCSKFQLVGSVSGQNRITKEMKRLSFGTKNSYGINQRIIPKLKFREFVLSSSSIQISKTFVWSKHLKVFRFNHLVVPQICQTLRFQKPDPKNVNCN